MNRHSPTSGGKGESSTVKSLGLGRREQILVCSLDKAWRPWPGLFCSDFRRRETSAREGSRFGWREDQAWPCRQCSGRVEAVGLCDRFCSGRVWESLLLDVAARPFGAMMEPFAGGSTGEGW